MTMKLTQLIQELSKLGVTFISHGANHDIYGKNGKKIPVPRHAEVNEMLARSILKKAKKILTTWQRRKTPLKE